MNSHLKAQNGFKKSTPSKRKRSPSPLFESKKKSFKSLDSEAKRLECTVVKKHEMVKQSGFCFEAAKTEVNNIENEMWVNKYKPKTLGRIINQNAPQSCANKLKNWLTNWHKNKNVKPIYNRFGNSNDNGVGMKAALLSGPPGIVSYRQVITVEQQQDIQSLNFKLLITKLTTNLLSPVSVSKGQDHHCSVGGQRVRLRIRRVQRVRHA